MSSDQLGLPDAGTASLQVSAVLKPRFESIPNGNTYDNRDVIEGSE